MREDIREAIEAAAGAGDAGISRMFGERVTPLPRRIAAVTNIVRRFLQGVDPELPAHELLREVED